MSHGETQQDNEDYSKANRATTKTETSILVEKFVEDHYDEVFRYYAMAPSKQRGCPGCNIGSIPPPWNDIRIHLTSPCREAGIEAQLLSNE